MNYDEENVMKESMVTVPIYQPYIATTPDETLPFCIVPTESPDLSKLIRGIWNCGIEILL